MFEPFRELGWDARATGLYAYHGWMLEPAAVGCRVVTEETQRGWVPMLARWYLRGALHGAHEEWLASLARIAPTGEPPAPKVTRLFHQRDFLQNLHWSAWARTSAHATGRIGWAQPGQGGNGINRQAPVRVRLYAVATHHGRRYFSRLAFSFTWRHHAYAGKVKFHDPCGNTAGCWTAPGMPVA